MCLQQSSSSNNSGSSHSTNAQSQASRGDGSGSTLGGLRSLGASQLVDTSGNEQIIIENLGAAIGSREGAGGIGLLALRGSASDLGDFAGSCLGRRDDVATQSVGDGRVNAVYFFLGGIGITPGGRACGHGHAAHAGVVRGVGAFDKDCGGDGVDVDDTASDTRGAEAGWAGFEDFDGGGA